MLATESDTETYEDLDQMQRDYQALTTTISRLSAENNRPDSVKRLRLFSQTEVANLIDISRSYVVRVAEELNLQVEIVGGRNQRFYTLSDINQIRQYLGKKAGDLEKARGYDPRRRGTEDLRVIAAVNFKGGSAKSTTSVHFAQYMALRGYRVLAIDLDPQGSLSDMFGCEPVRLKEDDSLYAALRYEDTLPLSQVIRKTYFPNLDLCPSGRWVSDWEFDAPRVATELKIHEQGLRSDYNAVTEQLGDDWLQESELDKLTRSAAHLENEITQCTLQRFFFLRLQLALADVQDDYDIVVCDTPPNLGYLSNAAITAANHLLVTVQPQMLDCESMVQYLSTTINHQYQYKAAIKNFLGPELVTNKTLNYLITRFGGTASQHDTATMLKGQLGRGVLQNMMLNSAAVEEARLNMKTLYESERSEFNPKTFDRAIEALNAVNQEIEQIVLKGWGRL
ncbi:AAA family ATPase [Pseudovibrio sp. Tun.PSC04-5.I4]|uniref:AAA family ATPase n=1 Tax=Pseudovibrio sp. Tun.PSC04-5.I4 TaxID=1798213 RepID=UPI00088F339A|nr:AAA family ATPase [Pseudovibrio sp. Tun.PSC04-5.I4]SDQ37090.1 Cellulose biosynthesis protein BcsQ [Pseudovibrio sp. Tun.PSC04-5.I4]